ncbi:hypothetical protein PVAND_001196 [Polypedilum vanderplanki]|uniref:ATP-dependent DNA helicase n=1 Tax=Polypedilum vanderplanki TaxID=319348 RepID=A0A9J6BML7_POLVA|nr:hypothetical protein PVAND_001196 [Polypedilum vanderplanki]
MSENQIQLIENRVKEIDEQIDKLQSIKRKLLLQREKLTDRKNFEKSEELAKNQWNQEIYPWSKMLREKMKDTFGIKEFRSQQLEAINATMSKHDLILIAPTSAGKSLCFQLPALCDKGITLVISPLISLIEDQIYSLEKKNIPAQALSSNSTKEHVKHIIKILQDPSMSTGKELKLLYVTPERLAKHKTLMQALQKCYTNKKLDRIAIDEVHCCSVLGHDFRPEYKFLNTMKTLFPETPIIGVTATASRKILIDVQKLLNIRGCIIFNSPFNRPNLYYHVYEKPDSQEDCLDLLADLLLKRYNKQTGIIYTFSIKDTETITTELLKRDCKVRPYHAQLDQLQRTKIYHQWMKGDIQAVVATIAFGMGVDNQNTRFVIHHTISKSMENFYQESGRCGRDGKFAECILLYRLQDMFKISTLTFSEVNGIKNTYSMVEYAINSKICRRDQFSKYFTEVWNEENCGKMCDSCYYKNNTRLITPAKINILPHYQSILKILDNASSSDTKMTANKLIDAWFQKGAKNLRIKDSSAPDIDKSYAEQILAFLIVNDYLREDFHYTAYNTYSYIIKGPRIIQDEEIEFQPARNFDLPDIEELKKFHEITSQKPKIENENKRNAPNTSSNCSSPSKKRKTSDDTIVVSSSNLEKLITSKIQKVLSASLKASVSLENNSDDEDDGGDDDDVMIVEPKTEDDVINLD